MNNQVSILEREFFSFREKFLRDRLSCAKGIGYCLKCMRGFFTNLGGGCEKSEAGDFLLLLTVENLTCSVLPICIGPPVLNVSQKKTAPARSQKHGTSPSECTKRTLHPRSSPLHPVYRFDTPSNIVSALPVSIVQAFFEASNLKKGNLKKEEEILSISIKTVCNEMRVLFNRAMVNKWIYVTMTATRNNHIRDVEILEKFSWDDPPRGSTVYRSSNLPLTAMLSGLLGDNGVRRRK